MVIRLNTILQYHVNIFAGVNIGSPCEFTTLSVLLSNHVLLKKIEKISGTKYMELSRLGYGMVSSFLSAVAQAHYQGMFLP